MSKRKPSRQNLPSDLVVVSLNVDLTLFELVALSIVTVTVRSAADPATIIAAERALTKIHEATEAHPALPPIVRRLKYRPHVGAPPCPHSTSSGCALHLRDDDLPEVAKKLCHGQPEHRS
ncbi:MAG: hypothetical protein M3443_08920 [Actinomycetota bacterium]|nr:hypothetical protein [Actinomycetota bacterium]